ncbi:pyrroloquinoline quinone biosynthesis peptide chaperone PqqD [Derxia lacustris]|uniref:pyrroloquinoline quinone biosynthesis peptide chaperone PqqD n=1 Tax=Derxia lacustris TaxID=764842 RepID=UPI000A16D01F|nr:pyrroloquinoline quinone biosynthesis peptide chaperone PqqD [Derxia lacustris]
MSAPVESDAALAVVPRVARLFRLQYEEVQQSWVLLYPEGMVKLNQSAGEIMSRCDGSKTVAQIVAELEAAFSATGLTADVLGFLDIARSKRWIET